MTLIMGGNISCTPPHPDARVIERVLGLSDERDTWTTRIQAEAQASYLAGYADGDRAGYERGSRYLVDTWKPICRRLLGETLAELNLRRWGPRGRERFGDSVASDRYPRPVAA